MSRLSFDCVLTESCNLRCDHCFQHHVLKNIPTLDSLNELKTILKETIEEESKCKDLTQVDLSFRGGEIFQDIIHDEVIEGYKDLILYVNNLVPNLDFNVDFVSNGIFKKHERILDLLESTNGRLSLSYDPVGRFKAERQLDLFQNSLNYFSKKKKIYSIYITLTKESIDAYMSDKSLLDRFDGLIIDVSYFIPNTISHSASDDDLFMFFKYLLDNRYFNVSYISDMIRNIKGELPKIPRCCNCANTIVVYQGKKHYDCNILIPNLKKEDFYDDISKLTDRNGVKLLTEQGINKRGCLLCNHFNSCPMYCWMTFNNKDYKMLDCPHKRIFEYIKNNIDSICGEKNG